MSDFNDGEEIPSRDEFLAFLSDFIASARKSDEMFRSNYCGMVVNKVYNDFGYEGLCNLMMAIDDRAHWISDILIENSDLDEIMFAKYGFYGSKITETARNTQAMLELNGKIWKLRRRYAKLIVEELINGSPMEEEEAR